MSAYRPPSYKRMALGWVLGVVVSLLIEEGLVVYALGIGLPASFITGVLLGSIGGFLGVRLAR